MFFLECLFVDLGCKLFRIKPTPQERLLNRERDAREEALALAMHDMQVDLYGRVARTFTHHHAAARARHGLTA